MAGFVFAQSDIKPEIRGSVIESGSNIGVAGAEITLFEFLPDANNMTVRTRVATTSTDAHGEFRFALKHLGGYYLEAKKDSYLASTPVASLPSESAGTVASVDREHPAQEIQLWLMRPGEVTGRVVDEDGNPVVGRRVGIMPDGSPIPFDVAPGPVTDQNGSFATGKMQPGEYLIRLSPKAGDFETVMPQFSEDDLKIVDQDFDSAAGPSVLVSPGATTNAGTITIRKAPYYKAHVSVVDATCSPKENWRFLAIPRSIFRHNIDVPCGKDFLIRNLTPASYWFILRSGKPEETGKWAMAEVEIAHENVEVSMTLSPAAEIRARLVAAEGVTLPKFPRLGIMMRGRIDSIFIDSAVGAPDAEGKFTVQNLLGIPHDVTVQGLGGRYYVKEIRYNGVAMPDGLVTPVSGAIAQDLEIVVDDKAGTITGSVRDGDKPVSKPFVLVVKWPIQEGDPLLSAERPNGDDQGKFQISGLAPGEYRVIALTKNIVNTEVSYQLLNRAEKITLERGSLKDISLKLIDASQ
jgi:hypothetical protein